MTTKLDDGLYNDPLLAQFYDSASQTRLDFAFCLDLAKQGQAVLDLGCGTGTLAVQLAKKCDVTAVEPAQAMLEIARKREGGGEVNWVLGDARTVRLDAKFDLIILTGHSFQVFLTQEDQMAVLKSIALHLKPEGRFVFDSRNPDFKAPKGRVNDSNVRILQHPTHGQIEMWNESDFDEVAGILTYKNGFKIVATGEEYAASEQIYYTKQTKIAEMLESCGLKIIDCYGDWMGAEFSRNAREIIPFGGVELAR